MMGEGRISCALVVICISGLVNKVIEPQRNSFQTFGSQICLSFDRCGDVVLIERTGALLYKWPVPF